MYSKIVCEYILAAHGKSKLGVFIRSLLCNSVKETLFHLHSAPECLYQTLLERFQSVVPPFFEGCQQIEWCSELRFESTQLSMRDKGTTVAYINNSIHGLVAFDCSF